VIAVKPCYDGRMTTTVLRLIAWLLAAAVTFATVGPARFRPHFAITHDGEHALAFVLVGFVFSLAYPRHRLPSAGVAVVLIGMLELLQRLVPGRHARLEDFIVDALAALAGFAIAAILGWMLRSHWHAHRVE
jgi:VanZ family protein